MLLQSETESECKNGNKQKQESDRYLYRFTGNKNG